MQDEPTPIELLNAVAEFLRNDIAPKISGMPEGAPSRFAMLDFCTSTSLLSVLRSVSTVSVSFATMPAAAPPDFNVTTTVSKPGAILALGFTTASRR